MEFSIKFCFSIIPNKDLIIIGSSDVNSLSFDFNIFIKLYKLFSLIFLINQFTYLPMSPDI